MLMAIRLPNPLKSATVSYRVLGHWARGGKLPGLCDEGATRTNKFKHETLAPATVPCLMLSSDLH